MATRLASTRRTVLLALLLGTLSCSDSIVAPGDSLLQAKQAPPPVLNYDERLDLADESITSARSLLLAAQAPLARNQNRPFGGHRDRAADLLEKALAEIQAARVYVSDAKNQVP